MSPVVERAVLPIRLVVLNHNGGDLTVRCLQHLLALDWPSEQLEIICLDNDSSDGSIDRIEREFSTIDVRRLGTNNGFPANNEALGNLDSIRYVGLVNNDAFVEPDWLRRLVAELDRDHGVGAVCPKILLEPKFATVSIQSSQYDAGVGDRRSLGLRLRKVEVDGIDVSASAHFGESGWGREFDRYGAFEWSRPDAVLKVPAVDVEGAFECVLTIEVPEAGTIVIDGGEGAIERVLPVGTIRVSVQVSTPRVDVINNIGSVVFSDGYGGDRGWLEIDNGQFDHPADVFAWCGGGVLFRPEFLLDVGLFEEQYFLYYEDTDLSWRGRARSWRYRTVPDARMRHVHAASTGEVPSLSSYLTERNRMLMLVRNASARLALLQALRFPLTIASFARRDLVGLALHKRRPSGMVVVLRLRSYLGFLKMVPAAISQRRQLRDRQIVHDSEIEGWFVSHG